MKKILVLMILSLLFVACKGQEKDNSDTKDILLFKDNFNSNNYKKYLESQNIELQTKSNGIDETVSYDRETSNKKKFTWKQYNFLSAASDKNVGMLYKMKLRELHSIQFDNQLVGLTGSFMYSDSMQVKNTIEYLTTKFGKPFVVTSGKFVVLKFWQNKDKYIGISSNGEEGTYLTNEDLDKGKMTILPIYVVYVFNKKVIENLKNENIELQDFFNGRTTGLEDLFLQHMIDCINDSV